MEGGTWKWIFFGLQKPWLKYQSITVFKLNELNTDFSQPTRKQEDQGSLCISTVFKESFIFSVQIGWEGGDAALCDFGVLVLILTDAVEVFNVAGPPQQLHKVLIMGDDQQLEVTLTRATLNDSGQSKQGEIKERKKLI